MHGFGVITNIPIKEKNEETPDLDIANIDLKDKIINMFTKKTDTLEEPVKKKTKDIYGEWVTFFSNLSR